MGRASPRVDPRHTAGVRVQLLTATDPQPDFLELPWDTPLAEWPNDLLVHPPRGVHRHVVVFVRAVDKLWALKELPGSLVEHEFAMLRQLRKLNLPVVRPVGTVTGRVDGLDDVLITRHLPFSLPYRHVVGAQAVPLLRDSMLDALAGLLVRLHLVGFFWGDCSLSNTLWRRDAGALSAYLVDAETSIFRDHLSDGQRYEELEIARLNILGGLSDLDAMGRLPSDLDPVDFIDDLVRRYEALWSEITRADVIGPHERYKIDARLARLNDLGFDTGELMLEPSDYGSVLRFAPKVVEEGHHRRQLERQTGIVALENQARVLLNDMRSYAANVHRVEGREVPEAVAGYRWLIEVYEPTLAAVPGDLLDRRQPSELVAEIIAYRANRASELGTDIKLVDAAVEFAARVLTHQPSEFDILDVDEPVLAEPVLAEPDPESTER